ncbi:MAG: potassium-transporting ATPase subunit C [Chloroflexi bacterium]|nr:MAG: potassium-transporting ATPase subunit C [Chloroflexota bacterium]
MAISIAPRFGPAQQNMRRLYELHSFGRSQEPLALGDAELGRLGEPRVNVPELNLALDRGGAR